MNAIICDRCKAVMPISSDVGEQDTVWFRVTVHNVPYDLCPECTDYIQAFCEMEDGLPTATEWARIKHAALIAN